MKPIFIALFVLIIHNCFGQVDNYKLLTKNIQSSGIKSITKYVTFNKSSRVEIKFKLNFDRNGQLTSLEEYRYFDMHNQPMDSIIMRQEMVYDSLERNVAIRMTAPDGSLAVDTMLYNDRNELVEKRRIVKGEIVRTWDYTDRAKDDIHERVYDSRGNLIKEIYNFENYTNYTYDLNDNLTEELIVREGKDYKKETYEYDKKNRLIAMKAYLMYISVDNYVPLDYHFKYEDY